MRRSTSFADGFEELLRQGLPKFGLAVINEKRLLVDDTIDTYLAEYARNGFFDPSNKLYTYHVTGTPFVVVYEFDDAELRVLFIVHKRTGRRRLKPGKVVC